MSVAKLQPCVGLACMSVQESRDESSVCVCLCLTEVGVAQLCESGVGGESAIWCGRRREVV